MISLIKRFRRKLKNHPLHSLFIGSALTILLGTFVYHFVEHLRWIDSLYFSVVTLTTVGYGDFSPKTDFGKLFTIFYILNGIGIIFGFINAYYDYRIKKENQRRKTKM